MSVSAWHDVVGRLRNVRFRNILARSENGAYIAADAPGLIEVVWAARPDDFGYAVFGRVLEGMDVVDKIAVSRVAPRDGMDTVPVTPVLIKSVREKK